MTDQGRVISITVIPWVPYREADPDTQERFERMARALDMLGDKNSRWECDACEGVVGLEDIGIAYETFIGLPVCPTKDCAGIGWEHFAAQ